MTFYLLQALHNWFWLLFILIYFEETIVQRNMGIVYIQSGLFLNISATEAYILKRDILVIPLFAMFSSKRIASYLGLLYCLCLIIFKFILQHFVPVNSYGYICIFGDTYIIDDYN